MTKILKKILPYLIAVAAAVVVFEVVTEVFHPLKVEGASMYPTLRNGQLITCNEVGETIETNDIVVFTKEAKKYIKRIVAIPGDKVVIRSGKLYVNDIYMEQYEEKIEDPGILENEIYLGNDEYIALGDNINNSIDSRNESVGIVFKNDIKLLVAKGELV